MSLAFRKGFESSAQEVVLTFDEKFCPRPIQGMRLSDSICLRFGIFKQYSIDLILHIIAHDQLLADQTVGLEQHVMKTYATPGVSSQAIHKQ